MPNVLIHGGGTYGDLFLKYASKGYKIAYFNPGTTFKHTYCEPENLRRMVLSSDIVVFTGGADIHPAEYKEDNIHGRTFYNITRDREDYFLFRMALRYGKKMVGICRGAQYLCARAGGSLIQDVSGHRLDNSMHSITTREGRTLEVNSTHHQMMCPSKTNHILLAWSENLSGYYNTTETELFDIASMADGGIIKEPEAVYFNNIDGLAIQWHPEQLARDDEARQYFYQLFDEYIAI